MSDKQSITWKGVKGGLHLILDPTQDFESLKDLLRERLKSAEFFFQGSDVILDTQDAVYSLEQVLEVQQILANPYGLKIRQVVNKGPGTGKSPGPRKQRKPDAGGQPVPVRVEPPKEVPRQAESSSWAPETLLHRGTLRSGQRILHQGNVVIVGEVNPGAEIRATGDIVVMGSLRGLAHAGSSGDPSSAIVAFSLSPTQIRIADTIGRPPEDDRVGGHGPEVARLKDGRIVVEPLEGTRWEG